MSFTERDGPTRPLGRELLDCTLLLFAYWYDFKEGRITREQFAARIAPVRADFERTLRRAIDANIKGLSGSCYDIWEHREALWTFVNADGVEPTNNHAERALRAFVLDRKTWLFCGHEQSARRAADAVTIITTCKNLGIEPRAYMRDTLRRILDGEKNLEVLLPENYRPRALASDAVASPSQAA